MRFHSASQPTISPSPNMYRRLRSKRRRVPPAMSSRRARPACRGCPALVYQVETVDQVRLLVESAALWRAFQFFSVIGYIHHPKETRSDRHRLPHELLVENLTRRGKGSVFPYAYQIGSAPSQILKVVRNRTVVKIDGEETVFAGIQTGLVLGGEAHFAEQFDCSFVAIVGIRRHQRTTLVP